MAKLRRHGIGGSLLIWYDQAEAHLNELSPPQILSGYNRSFGVPGLKKKKARSLRDNCRFATIPVSELYIFIRLFV